MISKGDTEKQATLRDNLIKKSKASRSMYVSTILSVLKPDMILLDVGCGTGHILQELATDRKRSQLVGLDVSKAMLKVAKGNCSRFDNVGLVVADGLELPFPDKAFDIINNEIGGLLTQGSISGLERRRVFL